MITVVITNLVVIKVYFFLDLNFGDTILRPTKNGTTTPYTVSVVHRLDL